MGRAFSGPWSPSSINPHSATAPRPTTLDRGGHDHLPFLIKSADVPSSTPTLPPPRFSSRFPRNKPSSRPTGGQGWTGSLNNLGKTRRRQVPWNSSIASQRTASLFRRPGCSFESLPRRQVAALSLPATIPPDIPPLPTSSTVTILLLLFSRERTPRSSLDFKNLSIPRPILPDPGMESSHSSLSSLSFPSLPNHLAI